MTKSPAECQTKEDVRAEIDRIDQGLLTLFAERHQYVTRMAQIKTDPHEAFDPARIEAVTADDVRAALARWLSPQRSATGYLETAAAA